MHRVGGVVSTPTTAGAAPGRRPWTADGAVVAGVDGVLTFVAQDVQRPRGHGDLADEGAVDRRQVHVGLVDRPAFDVQHGILQLHGLALDGDGLGRCLIVSSSGSESASASRSSCSWGCSSACSWWSNPIWRSRSEWSSCRRLPSRSACPSGRTSRSRSARTSGRLWVSSRHRRCRTPGRCSSVDPGRRDVLVAVGVPRRTRTRLCSATSGVANSSTTWSGTAASVSPARETSQPAPRARSPTAARPGRASRDQEREDGARGSSHAGEHSCAA
jgi:hypothetical protein